MDLTEDQQDLYQEGYSEGLKELKEENKKLKEKKDKFKELFIKEKRNSKKLKEEKIIAVNACEANIEIIEGMEEEMDRMKGLLLEDTREKLEKDIEKLEKENKKLKDEFDGWKAAYDDDIREARAEGIDELKEQIEGIPALLEEERYKERACNERDWEDKEEEMRFDLENDIEKLKKENNKLLLKETQTNNENVSIKSEVEELKKILKASFKTDKENKELKEYKKKIVNFKKMLKDTTENDPECEEYDTWDIIEKTLKITASGNDIDDDE